MPVAFIHSLTTALPSSCLGRTWRRILALFVLPSLEHHAQISISATATMHMLPWFHLTKATEIILNAKIILWWLYMNVKWMVYRRVLENTHWLHICMSAQKSLDGDWSISTLSTDFKFIRPPYIVLIFLQWLPWKESDYFCTQSVRTNRGQQQQDRSDIYVFDGTKHIWWILVYFYFLPLSVNELVC